MLAAHTIGKEAYGAFSALMGALLVISVLSLGLQATGARRISAHPDQVVAIERVVLGVGLRSALVLGALCLAARAGAQRGAAPRTASRPRCWSASAAFPLTYMGAQAGVLQGERRWEPLALVYLAQGLGRVVFGARADADLADRVRRHGRRRARLLAAGADRLARAAAATRATSRTARGTRASSCSARSGTAARPCSPSSRCRTPTSWSPARPCRTPRPASTPRGLIMAKAILFLPQFVVVDRVPVDVQGVDAPAHPAAGAEPVGAARRRSACSARWLFPDLALLFVGGDDFAAIADDLWKFAIVGTLLAMIQLLVYSALARRQGRAVIMIWTALAVLVVGALAVEHGHRRWCWSSSRSTPPCSWRLLGVALTHPARTPASRTRTADSRPRERLAERLEPAQCAASCQLRPVPTETSSGTSRSAAEPICSRTSASRASFSPGATSKTSSSWTWSSIREPSPASRDRAVDVEHRDLDQVGGRALDRRVERHPLGHLAALPVVAGEVGQVAAATHDRLGVAAASGLVDDAAEVVADAAEGLEVLVHQPARLARVDAELGAEAERRQAVGEAVVHRLDLGPHLDGDLVGRDVEDPRRGDRVEVAARLERLDQQRRPRRGGP